MNYIAEELWRRADFFQVFPLDGGGYFSFMDIVRATDDLSVANATLGGKIFDRFRDEDGRVDWELHDRWDAIERGVWLNRWYYLASTARMHWLKGDERFSEAVLAILRQWTSAVPIPKDYPAYFATFRAGFDAGNRRTGVRACSTWCDFQLAQRILVAYWTAFFLAKSTRWKREDWARLYELMIEHARLLYWADHDGTFEPGNHQMLRGFALMHAAAMLREAEEGMRWWDLGVRLMTLHAGGDFTSGGISREGSFSYQLFMLSQFVHATALTRALGKDVPPGWPALAKKMTRFLSATATPSLTTPVVNDGYEAQIGPVLDICRTLFPELAEAASPSQGEGLRLEHFPDAGVAVLEANRDQGRLWLLAECMAPYGHSGHWHAGKPTLHVWLNGEMLLGDAGCPNYDSPLYGTWFRRGPAHFAVTVDGMEDAEFVSDVRWNNAPSLKITRCERTTKGAVFEFESNGFQRLSSPVSYRRRVEYAQDEALTIRDMLASKRPGAAHTFRLHVPFLVQDVRLSGKNCVTAQSGGWKALVSCRATRGKLSTQLEKKPVSVGARQGEYPYLQAEVAGVAETEFVTRIVALPD